MKTAEASAEAAHWEGLHENEASAFKPPSTKLEIFLRFEGTCRNVMGKVPYSLAT
jgi:hypothetical protein